MKDFKSVQDLIIKAAFYDKVSTTISADEMVGGFDVLKITFTKGDKYSTTRIDLTDTYKDPEEVALFCCKRALYDLLCAPYEEMVYKKEN